MLLNKGRHSSFIKTSAETDSRLKIAILALTAKENMHIAFILKKYLD